MSEPLTVPAPEEIAARIRACREELAALRRLQRLARAAEEARRARQRDAGPAPTTTGGKGAACVA
jgi:hypothetical protein